MKKSIALAFLLLGLITFAQEKQVDGKGKETKRERFQDLTVEQKVELQVKKMTLELDLTTKQQAEVKKIVLEQAQKREVKKNEMKSKKEKGEKPSEEEVYNNKVKQLNEKIAMKAEFKKILTEEQMAKFEQMIANRSEKMAKKRNEGKGKEKGRK